MCDCLEQFRNDVFLTSCEDPIDQVVGEMSDLLMSHSYSELSPVPGADLLSSREHCRLGVESLQNINEILLLDKESIPGALDQLRAVYKSVVRICPLREELANKGHGFNNFVAETLGRHPNPYQGVIPLTALRTRRSARRFTGCIHKRVLAR